MSRFLPLCCSARWRAIQSEIYNVTDPKSEEAEGADGISQLLRKQGGGAVASAVRFLLLSGNKRTDDPVHRHIVKILSLVGVLNEPPDDPKKARRFRGFRDREADAERRGSEYPIEVESWDVLNDDVYPTRAEYGDLVDRAGKAVEGVRERGTFSPGEMKGYERYMRGRLEGWDGALPRKRSREELEGELVREMGRGKGSGWRPNMKVVNDILDRMEARGVSLEDLVEKRVGGLKAANDELKYSEFFKDPRSEANRILDDFYDVVAEEYVVSPEEAEERMREDLVPLDVRRAVLWKMGMDRYRKDVGDFGEGDEEDEEESNPALSPEEVRRILDEEGDPDLLYADGALDRDEMRALLEYNRAVADDLVARGSGDRRFNDRRKTMRNRLRRMGYSEDEIEDALEGWVESAAHPLEIIDGYDPYKNKVMMDYFDDLYREAGPARDAQGFLRKGEGGDIKYHPAKAYWYTGGGYTVEFLYDERDGYCDMYVFRGNGGINGQQLDSYAYDYFLNVPAERVARDISAAIAGGAGQHRQASAMDVEDLGEGGFGYAPPVDPDAWKYREGVGFSVEGGHAKDWLPLPDEGGDEVVGGKSEPEPEVKRDPFEGGGVVGDEVSGRSVGVDDFDEFAREAGSVKPLVKRAGVVPRSKVKRPAVAQGDLFSGVRLGSNARLL